MATTLVLEARYGGGRLELTPVPHPHDAAAKRPAWQARLTGRSSAGHAVAGSRFDSVADTAHGLVAEMVCPESPWEDQALHEFFAELYEERQGWDGEKSWVSQHEHLTLKAEHDYVNTVKLRIELRGIADPQWLAVVTVPVDPGVFHRIGANAKLFGDQLLGEGAETESA